MPLELMNNWSFGIKYQTCINEARIDKEVLDCYHCNDFEVIIYLENFPSFSIQISYYCPAMLIR